MARGSSTKSLPIGTQVVVLTPGQGPKDDEVCPQGSMGVVVGGAKNTLDSYQIPLTDGSIVTFSRACLAIRKHFQHDSAQDGRNQSTQPNFHNYIYRCVVIRLRVSGITILREGFVPLRIEEPPGFN